MAKLRQQKNRELRNTKRPSSEMKLPNSENEAENSANRAAKLRQQKRPNCLGFRVLGFRVEGGLGLIDIV